ncbi:MAG: hypothetical protein GXO69_00545 [Acidobacteria bacterium]|nr:hypothetical protein [Acidobacteriota bacterium]
MRFLLFTAVVFGIFYFFYNKLRRFLAQIFQPLTEEDNTAQPGGAPGRINKGEMKQCPACGVYFPAGTGEKSGGTEYCSAECARKGPAE